MPETSTPDSNLASHPAMAFRSQSAEASQFRSAFTKIAPLLALLIALGPVPSRQALANPISSCTANITGAAGVLNGIYPCSPKVIYTNHEHVLAFTLTFSTPGSGSQMDLVVTVNAPQVTPQAGTFTLGANNVTGSITLKQVAGDAAPKWAALTTQTSPPAAQNILKLDDLGSAVDLGKQQAYPSPSGSLSATLESQPGTGANGTVTVQLSFQPRPDQ